MLHLSFEVPDEMVTLVGSADATQRLFFQAGVHELLRRGTITTEQAIEWLGERTEDWMRLTVEGGSFDFWNEPEEDIYTLEDGEPR